MSIDAFSSRYTGERQPKLTRNTPIGQKLRSLLKGADSRQTLSNIGGINGLSLI